MPLDTRLQPQSDTDRRSERVSRVEQRARSRRATRRIVAAGVAMVALAAVSVLAARMAAPPDPDIAAPVNVDLAAELIDTRDGVWRTATPVLLTAATLDAGPATANTATGGFEFPPMSPPEADRPDGTSATPRRAGSSAVVSANVSVHEPGAIPANTSVAATGAPLRGIIVRGAMDSSGFVTVDVTVSEAIGVADLPGVLAALESFDYRDHGDGTITIDAGWVERNIVTSEVPLLGSVRCHATMIVPLTGALEQIVDEGLAASIDAADYGGCWVARRIDWSPTMPLSMHAWGLAIDLNVSTNALGAAPTMHDRVVAIFREHGFAWGGDWSRPDGMHFELHVPR